MKKNKTKLRHRFLRAPEGEGGDGANGGAPATGGGDEGSLIPALDGAAPPAGGTPPPGDGSTPPAGNADDPNAWIPEKFRVTGEDGKLDEAASARKLAESYKALEAHKGPLPQVPATPADYTFESPKDAEGKAVFDDELVAEFTGDPLFKGFAERAHAVKMTNEHLNFVLGEYLTVAPQLLDADKKLSLDEARTELQTIWKDDATMKANLADVPRAIRAFGAEADDVPGSRKRLMEKYGRDPDFIAFASTIAKEIKEDTIPNGGPVNSDVDVESLMKGKAYWDKNDPDHARVKAQVDTHFARKHGNARKR